ncbi:ACP phosphodiesterase [Desulfuromonas carbonis]|uniref:acyl carrier protein phosphodiesterase n=1 Tax=Desulfuromonas sp. DDH964 TaxID=1823759 RepID=UPI00078E4443|nr:ACP phosphodiesterase [Desulfuromonas sp. DDH964]AMV72801.1 ACP phosphodiesterase [Desulfuromonas sp. DDH964]
MNYLVHLYLSDPEPLCRLGNLTGDFVKGVLRDGWPPLLLRGLRQHRQVDVFAQGNRAFQRSRERLDPAFGLCRGILVDLFYDHFLARHWHRHAEIPLGDFAEAVYRDIETYLPLLPPGFQAVAPRMIAHDWLTSYCQQENVGRALERLGQRLRRPRDLAAGLHELQRHRAGLAADCDEFLGAARDFLRRHPLL